MAITKSCDRFHKWITVCVGCYGGRGQLGSFIRERKNIFSYPFISHLIASVFSQICANSLTGASLTRQSECVGCFWRGCHLVCIAHVQCPPPFVSIIPPILPAHSAFPITPILPTYWSQQAFFALHGVVLSSPVAIRKCMVLCSARLLYLMAIKQ